MPVPGLSRLKRLPQNLKNRSLPGGLILMYHRITDARPDPWNCCVSPANFAGHLAVLKKKFHPVPLQQICQTVSSQTPSLFSRRPVAITFDDGYADNLLAARPLLQRYEIPATVFVASGNIGRTREFWSDELERLLLQPGVLPRRLSLHINGEKIEWDVGSAESYSVADFRNHQGWNTRWPTDPTPRHTLYRRLYPLLQPLQEKEQEEILDQLREMTDSRPLIRETHRFLTVDELHSLASNELIEIGGHAVTHPMYSQISPEAQRDETVRGKQQLEGWLEQPVRGFAYPYGDYNQHSPAIVLEAGFQLACTTRRGVLRPQADLFELPRVQVQDWRGHEFAEWLSHWLYD